MKLTSRPPPSTKLAATIQEVTHNVQSTSHAAEEADRLANGSLELMQHMAKAVVDIGQAVNDLANAT